MIVPAFQNSCLPVTSGLPAFMRPSSLTARATSGVMNFMKRGNVVVVQLNKAEYWVNHLVSLNSAEMHAKAIVAYIYRDRRVSFSFDWYYQISLPRDRSLHYAEKWNQLLLDLNLSNNVSVHIAVLISALHNFLLVNLGILEINYYQ